MTLINLLNVGTLHLIIGNYLVKMSIFQRTFQYHTGSSRQCNRTRKANQTLFTGDVIAFVENIRELTIKLWGEILSARMQNRKLIYMSIDFSVYQQPAIWIWNSGHNPIYANKNKLKYIGIKI